MFGKKVVSLQSKKSDRDRVGDRLETIVKKVNNRTDEPMGYNGHNE